MAAEIEIYDRDLKGIKEAYNGSKSWEDVITSDYFNSDDNPSMEAFIDFVEETYQTKVKDPKHLQELTGIKSLLPKEPNIKKGNEATLEGILIKARYSKYSRALKTALQEGVKYKDLLQIKPQDYGLPIIWSGCLGLDQYSSILWAISFEFMLNETKLSVLLPDLRSIAQELEAPYSVLMDAYNIDRVNGYRKEQKAKRAVIEKKVKAKLPLLMDDIGDKYYLMFEEDFKKLKGKDLINFKLDVIEELQWEFWHTFLLLILSEIKPENKDEINEDELTAAIAQDIKKHFAHELIELKEILGL
jgi:hypothetical protein